MRLEIKIANVKNVLDIHLGIWYYLTMNGTVTKIHFFAVWNAFGFRKALVVLLSKEQTALRTLMKG